MRARNERGFTLLEVLVAVAIFALGSVSVLAVRTNCYREYRAARDFNTSRYLLQKQMGAVLVQPREFEDGDEGEFEDEEDPTIQTRYYWSLEMEEINLLGDEEDEDDDGMRQRVNRRDERNEDENEQGNNNAGLGGEDEEEQEVKVWRITVFVHYPGRRGSVAQISATTYIAADEVEDEEFF